MKRDELEHIIRASGEIAEVKKVIIFGSQSILAQFPDLSNLISEPDYSQRSILIQNCEILQGSIEADVMIPDSREKTELVEAVLGELSIFHDTFGYYAQGVDLSTSKLPQGWENRLIEVCNENTKGVSGMCLEIHDLIVSKLYANRGKDMSFFKAAVNLSLLSKETLFNRLKKVSISDSRKNKIENYIKKEFKK